jgi:hypothetical protein
MGREVTPNFIDNKMLRLPTEFPRELTKHDLHFEKPIIPKHVSSIWKGYGEEVFFFTKIVKIHLILLRICLEVLQNGRFIPLKVPELLFLSYFYPIKNIVG